MNPRAGLWIALVALLATSVFADRETAKFHVGRGEKALSGKKWDEAATHFRKALDEDGTYLPARHGLAQALLGAGDSAAAVDELRGMIDEARAAPSEEWKSLVGRAEKQLSELDAAGVALRKILATAAASFAEIGERWLEKDRVVAERALRRALELEPGNPKANQLLGSLGLLEDPKVVKLFDGKSFAGWVRATPPTFFVNEGAMYCEATEAQWECRSARQFQGEYVVRFELRILIEHPGTPYAGVAVSTRTIDDTISMGVLGGKVCVIDRKSPTDDRRVTVWSPLDFPSPFDQSAWNRFEAAFEKDRIKFRVNDVEIASEPRTERLSKGFIGLYVQCCRFCVRNIEVHMK